MNKIDTVVDNISGKVSSLNGLFSIIDFTTDKLSLVTDKFVDATSGLINKIFNKKKEEVKEDE